MNRLHKPHEIMCYAAIVAAVPLLAKFVEVASGSELPPTIWHITWLICGISLVVVCSCLVYIFVAIPLEAVLKRTKKSKVPSERQQKEVEDDKEPEAMITSVNEVDSQSKEHGQQLDERHQIFQPYVAVDEDDRPTAPVLDILVYAEPVNKVFVQGFFAFLGNVIITAILGTLIAVGYSKIGAKSSSLSKED